MVCRSRVMCSTSLCDNNLYFILLTRYLILTWRRCILYCIRQVWWAFSNRSPHHVGLCRESHWPRRAVLCRSLSGYPDGFCWVYFQPISGTTYQSILCTCSCFYCKIHQRTVCFHCRETWREAIAKNILSYWIVHCHTQKLWGCQFTIKHLWAQILPKSMNSSINCYSYVG